MQKSETSTKKLQSVIQVPLKQLSVTVIHNDVVKRRLNVGEEG